MHHRAASKIRFGQIQPDFSIKMTYDTYGHWIGDAADEQARLADDEAAVLGMTLFGS